MSKNKIFAFCLLILTVIIVVLLLPDKPKEVAIKEVATKEVATKEVTIEMRNETNNPAKTISLSEGTYSVGKDIEIGFYDIKYAKGEVKYNGATLSENDKILNVELHNRNRLEIEGNGEILFEPSEFSTIKKDNENNIIIQNSGTYIAGSDIPTGEYFLSLEESVNKDNQEIFVKIQSHYDSSETERSFSIKKANERNLINLSEGKVLYIDKHFTGEEELDTDIVLSSK